MSTLQLHVQCDVSRFKAHLILIVIADKMMVFIYGEAFIQIVRICLFYPDYFN